MQDHRPATERFWDDAGPVRLGPSPAQPPAAQAAPAAPAYPPPGARYPAPDPVPRRPGAPFRPAPALPPAAPEPPSGPPARTGAAMAALLCAVATLLIPALASVTGFLLLALLPNIPGVVFGALAVGARRRPEAVERYIAATWAWTLGYLALIGVIVAALALLILSFAA
ncbi:hypothetical protein [Nocardiopsis coralliicola]